MAMAILKIAPSAGVSLAVVLVGILVALWTSRQREQRYERLREARHLYRVAERQQMHFSG